METPLRCGGAFPGFPPEEDRRLSESFLHRGILEGAANGDPGQNRVRMAGQSSENLERIPLVAWLPENFLPQHHRRVCAEDDFSRQLLGHSKGLFERQPSDIGSRQFSWNHRFIDLGRVNDESQTQTFKKLSTARRSRGQNETW